MNEIFTTPKYEILQFTFKDYLAVPDEKYTINIYSSEQEWEEICEEAWKHDEIEFPLDIVFLKNPSIHCIYAVDYVSFRKTVNCHPDIPDKDQNVFLLQKFRYDMNDEKKLIPNYYDLIYKIKTEDRKEPYDHSHIYGIEWFKVFFCGIKLI